MPYSNPNISADIVLHSIVEGRVTPLITYVLEYPRFIHGELMTHRFFSRNAASSRAIPIEKMIAQVTSNPAGPSVWGLNQAGMQAELFHMDTPTCEWAWGKASQAAAQQAEVLQALGLHKQIVNRLLEPFQKMKTIVTATHFDNWFHLRKHPDAQPEIQELASKMWDALQASEPQVLKPGEYHMPYVDFFRGNAQSVRAGWEEGQNWRTNVKHMNDRDETVTWDSITLEQALMISSSCCAQVSYRLLNTKLDLAMDIYKKLVESKPVHASPLEHQAMVMQSNTAVYSWEYNPKEWEVGVTHMDKDCKFWSGNFQGWIQHRQLIPNNVCYDYEATL